jgi:hypothetical protein
MGASSWSYLTKYQPDLDAALAKLQQQEFRAGRYYRPKKAKKPKSIAELRKQNAEEGTHSILDITRVGPRPNRPGEIFLEMPPPDPEGHRRWLEDWNNRFGTARELHPDDLVEFFGTLTPSRAQVDERLDELIDWRSRWQATIVVVHDAGKPTEILFAGVSGD